MQLSASMQAWHRRARHLRRTVRARLRRDGATAALLVVLALGLGEPLVCIIHCQFWLPIVLPSLASAHHYHTHATAVPSNSEPLLTTGGAATLPGIASCLMRQGPLTDSDLSIPVPASPVHEMVLAIVALLAVVPLISRVSPAPLTHPPCVVFPPPLRPPNLRAA